MKFKTLGTSGLRVSAVALGTWAIGGIFWGGTDEIEAEKAIRASIENGINFIDTAPAYGFGLAEKIISRIIKNKRGSVVIATKCGLVWGKKYEFLHYKFPVAGKNETIDVYRNLKKDSINKEIRESLLRLGTDYIDLYITHWPDPNTSSEETMEALNELKEKGLIRAIGLSNVNVDLLDDFSKHGIIDADQEQYSVIDTGLEDKILPWCRQNNTALLAYSPLAMGLLTGKLDPSRKFTTDDARLLFGGDRFKPEKIKAANELLKKYIGPSADKHKCTIGNIIIAYFIQQEQVIALRGARNEIQAAENAKAGEITLDEEDNNAVKEFLKDYKEFT
ncbi:MAG: aldo/keto reductase [Actinobacteria bacterium]|nr:aldo/keto reductase [Actinomycetota bacterium]